MNNTTVAGTLWMWCVGCGGKSPTPTDSASPTTDTEPRTNPDSGDTHHTGQVPGASTVITQASATCDEGDLLTVFAEASGWTGGGILFMQETGNREPQHNETHILLSYDAAPSGLSDKLKVTLTTNVPPPYVPGTSSLFSCDDHVRAVDDNGRPSVLTYVVLVVDDSNQPIDCMAFGHDPAGLLTHQHGGVNDPPPIVVDMFDRCVSSALSTP